MDLILIKGNIYKVDKNNTSVEAIAINGNKIYKTGTTQEILKLKGKNTKVIDLEGKSVFPGFNDSHMHLLNYGYALTQADLIGTTSISELQIRMKNHIKNKDIEKGKWVLGRGWNHDYFIDKKVFPTRYDLDEVSKEHPIVVTRACGHVATVNSKALELIGIKKGTPQFEGGHFDLDENSEPIGIFRENALTNVYKSIPSPTIDEVKQMMLASIREMNKYGITSVGTDDFEALPDNDYEKVLKGYSELKSEGKLNMRIYQQCLISNIEKYKEFLDKGYRTGDGDEFLKIGPLKILLDGSLGARTAALEEPYADDKDNVGIVTSTKEELNDIVLLANKNNCQVAIHGIGDRAIQMALSSIGNALDENPRKNHRHGIVHAQITNKKIFNKFKDINAMAYIQPIFLDYDWSMVSDRVGKNREKYSYNWKTMIDMGIHASMGSDAPVETFNVMKGIYEAVTRKDLKGNPEGGWLREQALTVEESIYGYTMEGAYASFEESIKGSLEEGKLADIVVLSGNPYTVDPNEIKDIEAEMTIIDGRIVYERN